MAAKIKGAKLIIAEKSGHMVPLEQPQIVIDTVIEVFELLK